MRFKFWSFFFVVFFLSSLSFAEPLKEVQPSPKDGKSSVVNGAEDKGVKKKDTRIPISIIYQGQDSIGMRLVLEIKERLVGSKIFRLSDSDEKKVKIYIKTKEEFSSRPGLGCVYSVVWTFSPSEDVLPTYLDVATGVIGFNQIKSIAEVLIYRTDEITTQYNYLFER